MNKQMIFRHEPIKEQRFASNRRILEIEPPRIIQAERRATRDSARGGQCATRDLRSGASATSDLGSQSTSGLPVMRNWPPATFIYFEDNLVEV
jgi:hypothetical protein